MLCHQCGSPVSQNESKCPNCGANLNRAARSLPGAGLKRFTQQLKAVQQDTGRLLAQDTVVADRFVVGELLGDGPFGQVYAAQDKEIEDTVALKVLRGEILPTEKDRERYFSVTRGARANTQRHVARLHESGAHEDVFWVSRQHLDGLSLRKVLKLQASKGEVSSLDELERLITQLTHALQHIGPDHSHGDLKPENIFLMPDVLKVTDAYVMSALPPAIVADRLASSPYLAPELRKAGATLTPRCDVYSLGVILSELAFGKTSPPEAGAERGEREEIAALCRRAMSQAPTARPGSAEAFSEELSAILDAKRLGARRAKAPTPAAPVPPVAEAKLPPAPPAAPEPAPAPKAPPAPPAAPEPAKAEPVKAEPVKQAPPAPVSKPEAKVEPKPAPKAEPAKKPAEAAKKAPEPAKKPESAKKPEPAKKTPAPAKRADASAKRAEDEIATVELDRGAPPTLGDLLPTNEVERGAVPAPRQPQLRRETTQSIVVDKPANDKQQARSGLPAPAIVIGVAALVLIAALVIQNAIKEPEVVTLGDEPVAQAPATPPTTPPANPTAPAVDPAPAPNPSLDAAQLQAGSSISRAATDASAQAAQPAQAPAVDPALSAVAPKVDPPKVDPPKTDPPKVDPPKTDPAKVIAKVDPPKTDPPKTDPVIAKVELPKVDPVKAAPAAAGTKCPGGMGLVKRKEGNVCVDLYEFPGKGQRPKTNVSWFDARKSCEAGGKRLCAASEWRAACGGKYPYGKSFDATKCNTQDEDGFERSLATGGSFGACKSPSGAFDMTGNVHEWVEEKRIAGGAYDSDEGVAACGYSSPKAPGSSGGSIGFRCCASPE